MPSYIDTSTIVAIVASTTLICISLSSLPNWARVFTRKDKPEDSKDANDDLANPMAIINKLRWVLLGHNNVSHQTLLFIVYLILSRLCVLSYQEK